MMLPRNAKYRAIEVEWPSLTPVSEYGNVIGGSLEWGAFTDLKAGGYIDFKGDAPSDRNMLAIEAETGGETYRLGTYFVACSEPTVTPSGTTGTADLYSVLQVLADDGPGYPYTVGGDALASVAGILGALHVQVGDTVSGEWACPSHTFEPSDSWLAICNWALTNSGLAALQPDAYGRVTISRYVEPSKRATAWEFAAGEASILAPAVKVRSGYLDMANVVRLSYSDEESAWWASATLHGPARLSVESRGRRKAIIEQADDASSVDDLKQQARKRLLDNMAEIEYLSFSHPWVPIGPNDAVAVDYGERWQGNITSMRLALAGSMSCETEARRFITADPSDIELDGGSYA